MDTLVVGMWMCEPRFVDTVVVDANFVGTENADSHFAGTRLNSLVGKD